MLNSIKVVFLCFYLLFQPLFMTFWKLGQKNVKIFVGFWGMRRQDYLLSRFTDLFKEKLQIIVLLQSRFFFQVDIKMKVQIMNALFKCFLFFMNQFNMSIHTHFLAKTPLWTDFIWPCKFIFWEKVASQTLHLNGFLPSWTDSICLLKTPFWEKAV